MKGTIGLLGVLFVGLKLAAVIDWSWWWVTVPFWGPWVVIVVLAVVSATIRHLETPEQRAARHLRELARTPGDQ